MSNCKIRVENLVKFLVTIPKRSGALEKGLTKDEIMKQTGFAVCWGVSFQVEEGQILVVMGLSGSGKSTLIRLLNRLIEPTAGKVFVDDEEVTAMNAERLRKYVEQSLLWFFKGLLCFHRTIIENVEYGLEIQD